MSWSFVSSVSSSTIFHHPAAALLYWVDDLDPSETAQRLGVTVRTVERHLSKAREYLQRRAGL